MHENAKYVRMKLYAKYAKYILYCQAGQMVT